MDALSTARALATMIPTTPVQVSPRVVLSPRWIRNPIVSADQGHSLVIIYQPKDHPFQVGTRFTLYHNVLTIATGTDMYWDPHGALGPAFYHFEILWKNLPQFTTPRSQRRLRSALLERLTHRRRY